MADWQPIETAPKDGTEVLLYDARSGDFLVADWEPNQQAPEHGWRSLESSAYHFRAFTHWMALPAPPQGAE